MNHLTFVSCIRINWNIINNQKFSDQQFRPNLAELFTLTLDVCGYVVQVRLLKGDLVVQGS